VPPLSIAVLGLGEAGRRIAADLAAAGAGATVTGYDPVAAPPDGVRIAASAPAAVTGADLVLSVNSAAVAENVAGEAMPTAPGGAVWADLNTAAPALKRRLAATAARHGLRFADVALLGPVPARGLATPALATGTGAEPYAVTVNPLGGRVRVLAGEAGDAATRKLVRSVFMKGLAAAVIESLAAARAAGCEDWLRADLAAQLGGPLVERLERGSVRHATRRAAEMAAADELLAELSVPARVTGAARQWLLELGAVARDGSVE
jgi:3-hydroxyisobutyrate dehydrogenase-like beta-hydroxyacid dehydrogenase